MGIWYQCLSDECEAVFEAGDEITNLELPDGEERFVMLCPACGGEVSMEDPQPYDSPVPSRVDAPPDSQWVVVSKQGKAHLLVPCSRSQVGVSPPLAAVAACPTTTGSPSRSKPVWAMS